MDFTEAYTGTCSSIGLAARNGDVASLNTLLEGGGCVDTRDNRGWISFHEAAFHGRAQCLQMLLTSKPCLEDRSVLDHCTFEGETALLLAARQGHVDCMRLLLSHGADAKKSTHEGFSPLWEAVSSRKAECVKLLLRCSGQTETGDQGTSPNRDLHPHDMDTDALAEDHVVKNSVQASSVDTDHSDDVQDRLAKESDSNISVGCTDQATCIGSENCINTNTCGDKCVQNIGDDVSERTWKVDVNCRTYTGQRPLHQAAETGQCNVVQLLLNHGAKLDTYDDNHISPVFLAAHSGQNDCIRLMLDEAKKQNKAWLVNSRACDAATPLYLAAQRGHTETVRVLLEYGANANLMSENPRLLPLHAAIQLRHFGCMEVLFPVTSQEAVAECDIGLLDVSLPNLNLRSLQIMIRHGVDVVEELNFIPTDMVQENSYSIFPFVTEEPFCYKTLMLIGLAAGGDVDIFPEPGQRCPVVRCLLEAGVSPDPQIGGEMPPIVAAVYINNPEVLDVLLEHGANPRINQTDFSGNVAVIMAAGLVPPSPCLLQLFLAGQTPDSCFGRRPRCARRFPGKTWTLQKLLMCYPDRNPWLSFQRLRCLVSLSWSPQLHPGLKDIVQNTTKWQQLEQLVVECSSLAHLCRRQIYRSVASKTLYVPDSLANVELPKTLISYLFSSTVGQCYQELSVALYTDRQQRINTT